VAYDIFITLVPHLITISLVSLFRDPYLNLPALHPYQLNALKSVTEITGIVIIQGKHKDFKDLSFLGNLTAIYGRKTKK
jgi:hypothetical protein